MTVQNDDRPSRCTGHFCCSKCTENERIVQAVLEEFLASIPSRPQPKSIWMVIRKTGWVIGDLWGLTVDGKA